MNVVGSADWRTASKISEKDVAMSSDENRARKNDVAAEKIQASVRNVGRYLLPGLVFR